MYMSHMSHKESFSKAQVVAEHLTHICAFTNSLIDGLINNDKTFWERAVNKPINPSSV